MREKVKAGLIAQVATESYNHINQSQALHTLGSDYMQDTYIEILVDEILSSKTPQRERLASLGRLLSTYGVGTIVQGRIN
jgi:hypothetical protein